MQTPRIIRNVPRAFTLIELLIAIVLIALLLGLLLPSLKGARESDDWEGGGGQASATKPRPRVLGVESAQVPEVTLAVLDCDVPAVEVDGPVPADANLLGD